jgi:DNA-binding NarL/FixJ family response regulator
MAKNAKKKSQSKKIKSAKLKIAEILIVDDHPIVRRGLVELINSDPHLRVTGEAEDYHGAIDALKQKRFDLAIIDLTLRDIGGLELIKQLKVLHPKLYMLVLSMHDESLFAERALRAGSRGYVMKQTGSIKLITAIHRVLSGEVYLSEEMASRVLDTMVGSSDRVKSDPLEKLSDRELEVFQSIGSGLTTRQVSERLCVSIKTIESHRENIKAKLRLSNATELIQHATRWAGGDV